MDNACAAWAAFCRCGLDASVCDGRHMCDCGGSWVKDGDQFTALLLPHDGTWMQAITFTDTILRSALPRTVPRESRWYTWAQTKAQALAAGNDADV